jgi:hypothetical protein
MRKPLLLPPTKLAQEVKRQATWDPHLERERVLSVWGSYEETDVTLHGFVFWVRVVVSKARRKGRTKGKGKGCSVELSHTHTYRREHPGPQERCSQGCPSRGSKWSTQVQKLPILRCGSLGQGKMRFSLWHVSNLGKLGFKIGLGFCFFLGGGFNSDPRERF